MSENNPSAMTVRDSRFVNVGGEENVINYHTNYKNCTVNNHHHHPPTQTLRIIYELRAPSHVTHMPVDLDGVRRHFVNEGEGHVMIESEEVRVKTIPSQKSAAPKRRHQGNMVAGGDETEVEVVSKRKDVMRRRQQTTTPVAERPANTTADAAATTTTAAIPAVSDTVTINKRVDTVRILDIQGRVLVPGDGIHCPRSNVSEFSLYVGDGYIIKREHNTGVIRKDKLDLLQPFLKLCSQHYHGLLPAEERVRRAEGRVGQVVEGDSFRFVPWCYYG